MKKKKQNGKFDERMDYFWLGSYNCAFVLVLKLRSIRDNK